MNNIQQILKENNILEFNLSFKKLLESKLNEKLGLNESFDAEDIAEFFANGEHEKEVKAFLVGKKNIQDVYDELVDRDFDKDIIDDFKDQYM